MTGWLDEHEQQSIDQTAINKKQAVDFAQLYLVFEQDARAKALLEHWERTIEARDTPPDSSHAVYAYAEGRRVFVRSIRREIEFARQNA